jgi:uncharacterized protein (TIGR02246 family)
MTTANVEKELTKLENDYWQAIKDRNAAVAMKLTDESCIVTGAQGVGRIDKKTLEAMMKGATYELKDFEVSDFQIQMLRDDVAIVAYKVREKLTVDGKSVTLDAADASTWVKRDGRWLCALHTESIAGDPFGRDRKPS